RLWMGAEFAARSSLATRVLMVAVFANVAARPALAVIQGRAHPLALAWVYAGELVLHLPLALALVSRWGITGASVAWGLRVVVDAAVLRALAARTLGTPVGEAAVVWLPLAALAGLVVLLDAADPSLPVRLVGGAVLAGAAFLALLSPPERRTLLASLAVRGRPDEVRLAPAGEQVGVPDPEEPEASL